MSRNRRRIDRTESAHRLKVAGTRLLRVLAITSGVCAGVTAAGYGGLTSYTWLTHSPRFGISRITIEGTKRASNDEVLRLSGLQLGQNIFKADLGGAAQQVATQRWVKSASVDRRGTTEVRIQVEERQPSVLVDLGSLYVADTEGQIFKRLDRDRLDLPVVTGISREAYEKDPQSTRELLLSAEALVSLYHDRGLEADRPIEEVEVDSEEGLSLVLGGGSQTVLLGAGPYEQKLDRLASIRGELKRRGAVAEVVHLESQTRPNQVAVKLAGVPEAAPVKASLTRRN